MDVSDRRTTPLMIGLRLYNQNPSLWSVPKKNSYGYSKLMNLIPSKKPRKDIHQEERVQRLLKEVEQSIGIGYV